MPKIFFVVLCLAILVPSLGAQTQAKFKAEPGMVFLGGQLAGSVSGFFSEQSGAILNLNFDPLFGQFITREIMIFTHLDFNLNIGLTFPLCEGFLAIGVQGRYYFSTTEALNFFTGLELALGTKLTGDINNLHEHIACGLVSGLFFPVNERIGFDLSLNCLALIPLNTTDLMGARIYLCFGLLSII